MGRLGFDWPSMAARRRSLHQEQKAGNRPRAVNTRGTPHSCGAAPVEAPILNRTDSSLISARNARKTADEFNCCTRRNESAARRGDSRRSSDRLATDTLAVAHAMVEQDQRRIVPPRSAAMFTEPSTDRGAGTPICIAMMGLREPRTSLPFRTVGKRRWIIRRKNPREVRRTAFTPLVSATFQPCLTACTQSPATRVRPSLGIRTARGYDPPPPTLASDPLVAPARGSGPARGTLAEHAMDWVALAEKRRLKEAIEHPDFPPIAAEAVTKGRRVVASLDDPPVSGPEVSPRARPRPSPYSA